MMAERLAASGYAVLVANPFYRHVKAPQFNDFADFQAKGGFQQVGPWRAAADAPAIMRDTKSLVAWLDQQGAVDAKRGVGTQGYCMGGPFTVWSAAGVPNRVKAAASFHGGGLVGDGDTAPINLFDDAKDTHYLIAIAQNDDAKAPDEKTKLRTAADANGVEAEIEVYAGDHGWTVYDSPAYNEAAAEKAWSRLLATYQKAL
jgi:carboxymethylenebutenolidase